MKNVVPSAGLSNHLAFVVTSLVVVVLPFIATFQQAPDFAVQNPVQMFDRGLEWTQLTFPLLAVLLGVLPLVGQTRNGFLALVRTRMALKQYLLQALAGVFLRAGGVFAVAVFIWFVFVFVVEPEAKLVGAPTAQGDLASQDTSTFSQLMSLSLWVYGVVYSLWVGLWAGLIAVLAGLLLIVLPSQLLALTLPFIVWWAENLVLALAGLDRYRTITAVFPHGISQQPLWTVAVPLVLWCLFLAAATWYARSRRLEFTATL